jgi:hypothetical protein
MTSLWALSWHLTEGTEENCRISYWGYLVIQPIFEWAFPEYDYKRQVAMPEANFSVSVNLFLGLSTLQLCLHEWIVQLHKLGQFLSRLLSTVFQARLSITELATYALFSSKYACNSFFSSFPPSFYNRTYIYKRDISCVACARLLILAAGYRNVVLIAVIIARHCSITVICTFAAARSYIKLLVQKIWSHSSMCNVLRRRTSVCNSGGNNAHSG